MLLSAESSVLLSGEWERIDADQSAAELPFLPQGVEAVPILLRPQSEESHSTEGGERSVAGWIAATMVEYGRQSVNLTRLAMETPKSLNMLIPLNGGVLWGWMATRAIREVSPLVSPSVDFAINTFDGYELLTSIRERRLPQFHAGSSVRYFVPEDLMDTCASAHGIETALSRLDLPHEPLEMGYYALKEGAFKRALELGLPIPRFSSETVQMMIPEISGEAPWLNTSGGWNSSHFSARRVFVDGGGYSDTAAQERYRGWSREKPSEGMLDRVRKFWGSSFTKVESQIASRMGDPISEEIVSRLNQAKLFGMIDILERTFLIPLTGMPASAMEYADLLTNPEYSRLNIFADPLDNPVVNIIKHMAALQINYLLTIHKMQISGVPLGEEQIAQMRLAYKRQINDPSSTRQLAVKSLMQRAQLNL